MRKSKKRSPAEIMVLVKSVPGKTELYTIEEGDEYAQSWQELLKLGGV